MDAMCRERWSGLQALEPVLRGYLGRRCRDESEMDDVIQETYLRAARYRRSLVDPERLRGWALRIASNVLRDQIRRTYRTPRADADADLIENLPGREPSPDEVAEERPLRFGALVMDREALLGHLHTALRGLRDEDRSVLRSYYAGGKSCARTSAECDIPPALVKVRLFRARRRLSRALARRFPRELEGESEAGPACPAPDAS